MTRDAHVRMIVDELIKLASIHPASGVLGTQYRRAMNAIAMSRGLFVLRTQDVLTVVRASDAEDNPVDALYQLSAAAYLLGTCEAYKDHAAWAILHRAVSKRCKTLRAQFGSRKDDDGGGGAGGED